MTFFSQLYKVLNEQWKQPLPVDKLLGAVSFAYPFSVKVIISLVAHELLRVIRFEGYLVFEHRRYSE